MGDPVPVGDRDEVGVRMSQHLDSVTAIYVGSRETVPQEYELDPIRDTWPHDNIYRPDPTPKLL